MSTKTKKKLVIACAIILVVILIGYILVIQDSSLNIYKKLTIHSDATEYIEENYPDFNLSDVEVDYDKALNYYIAECYGAKDTITLHYSPDLSMELDCYYDEIYTSKAVAYQKEAEEFIASALKEGDLECDEISVFVDLDASDKEKIVYDGEEIQNERIDCYVTYSREKGESPLETEEFAALSKDVARCIYAKVGDSATIRTLKIQYDYDETGLASISWSPRMDEMTIEELAEEVKY